MIIREISIYISDFTRDLKVNETDYAGKHKVTSIIVDRDEVIVSYAEESQEIFKGFPFVYKIY